MTNGSATIVQKLLSACYDAQAGWNYCNVLRDDLSACYYAQAGGMSKL